MISTGALHARAPGKINLCLFVGTPRADGLHPLVSVVQPLTLADELCLEPAPPGATSDEVRCPGVEGDNLAADALTAYRAVTGWTGPPLKLTIAKHVPVAAGMGGGSGDAAAALRLAAHAAGRPDDPVLRALAPRLGADVPAQIEPARALVTGVGDDVRALPEPAPFGVLVLPGRTGLSTRDVYAQADRMGLGRSTEDLRDRETEVRGTATALPFALLHNDLQAAARALVPAIDETLSDARAAGADHAMVTGSGPTVVGLFTGRDGLRRAQAAAAELAGSGAHPRAVAAGPAGPRFGSPRPGP